MSNLPVQLPVFTGLTKPQVQAKWTTFSPLFSMKLSYSSQKAKFLKPPVSVFVSQYFFSPIIILFIQSSHKMRSPVPKIWPIQGLLFNILFQTHWLHLFKNVVQHVCFVKGKWTCGNRERNFLLVFQKSPRFSLTSSLYQPREKSNHPVFT